MQIVTLLIDAACTTVDLRVSQSVSQLAVSRPRWGEVRCAAVSRRALRSLRCCCTMTSTTSSPRDDVTRAPAAAAASFIRAPLPSSTRPHCTLANRLDANLCVARAILVITSAYWASLLLRSYRIPRMGFDMGRQRWRGLKRLWKLKTGSCNVPTDICRSPTNESNMDIQHFTFAPIFPKMGDF